MTSQVHHTPTDKIKILKRATISPYTAVQHNIINNIL